MKLTANLLTEVCNDVCIELDLQPITEEVLTGATSNAQDGARLDIAANVFWGGQNILQCPSSCTDNPACLPVIVSKEVCI